MILTDDQTAVMDVFAFEQLPEYSSSMPTSLKAGRTWKAKVDYFDVKKGWWFAETLPDSEPGFVFVKWRRLYVA